MSEAGADQVVRQAVPADAAAIGRLLHGFQVEFDAPSPGADWYAGRYATLLGDPATVVLLVGAPEEGVAVLRLRPSLYSDANEGYLAELYVVPERRGRGLGQALLEATVATARAGGADTLNVNTSMDDLEARALYAKLGFTDREGGPEGPLMIYLEREL